MICLNVEENTLPIYQSLYDNETLFKELKHKPIILNDLANTTTQDREQISYYITTTYSGDMVSIMPSCKCGNIKGEFSRPVICDICHTTPSAAIEDTIEPLVWFRRPHGVEKLFSPILWIMLVDRFNKGKFNIIRYLTDTSYAPQNVSIPDFVEKVEKEGIERGYNYFVKHFFKIVHYLLTLKEFRPKKNEIDYLAMLIDTYQDRLFSDYIPMINKALLIIEDNSFAKYVDNTVPMAMDAIITLVSIDRDFYDQSGNQTDKVMSNRIKENRTARAMYLLSCSFFDTYIKNIVSKKPGLLRHQLGGSRFDFSARAVISSITDPHRYDEIEVPWGIGLAIFRPFLVNKLVKKHGMLTNDAVGMLLYHTGIYHPLLDACLKEIISETKEGRYPILFNRFPSLLQGSIQRMFIPFVKTDPDDLTLGISILAVSAPNASKLAIMSEKTCMNPT